MWSLEGGCVAGPLFSYPGAFLAASRAFGAIAAVLQDTQNGPASAAARRALRGDVGQVSWAPRSCSNPTTAPTAAHTVVVRDGESLLPV